MKVMILNGPNINMVGIREKEIYGTMNYNDMLSFVGKEAEKRNIQIICIQSNHEGDLVDALQKAYFDNFDGVVINPAAYTHTSVAIADAIKAIHPLPVVEVHLSDISEREEFRQLSYCAPYCIEQIKGLGVQGYVRGLDTLVKHKGEKR